VKIISLLLSWLPETYDYRVLFMHRDLDEILASQRAMLAKRGEPADGADDARMRQLYTSHLQQTERLLAGRRCFRTLHVQYRDVVTAPAAAAERVAGFLDLPLDRAAMATAVDAGLYRNRA
jgi:hypothetical protein